MSSTEDLRRLKEEKLRRLYQADPVLYAEHVLKQRWWDKQVEIARAFATKKKVLVKASHGVGKSHVAGGLVNWSFDLWTPSLTLTTAPTKAQVVDVLWKEVRRQRAGRPGLLPKAPRMESAEDHFAAGYTARDGDAFQGRHEERGVIIFEEAVGIDGMFWDAAEGIVAGGDWHWLCIFNPTDVSSRAYEEEQSGEWDSIRVSALDHPNILAGLRGEPDVFPGAVNLTWVEDKIRKWCSPVVAAPSYQDFEWPPGSGQFHHPGPLFESRVLGRWPSGGIDQVWSEALWEAVLKPQSIAQKPLEIGCDVARFGDDWTVIVVRRGACVLHHERHNKIATNVTAGRLKQLATQFADEGEDPRTVEIKIDDDGVGGGVVDNADGWNFVPVKSGLGAIEHDKYPNRRSELWFSTAMLASEGLVDLSRLDDDSRRIIRRQLLTPKWKPDSAGRRVVEPKADTKRRLKKNNPDLAGGSPDDADALNLAFAPADYGVFVC